MFCEYELYKLLYGKTANPNTAESDCEACTAETNCHGNGFRSVAGCDAGQGAC